MGDMDQNNQFQPTALCSDAIGRVAQQAANKAGHTEHNNVHSMNIENREMRKKDE